MPLKKAVVVAVQRELPGVYCLVAVRRELPGVYCNNVSNRAARAVPLTMCFTDGFAPYRLNVH